MCENLYSLNLGDSLCSEVDDTHTQGCIPTTDPFFFWKFVFLKITNFCHNFPSQKYYYEKKNYDYVYKISKQIIQKPNKIASVLPLNKQM